MGNNYYTKYQNTAPKTAFTVAAMDVPFGELDKAITKLKNIAIGGGGTITYVKETGVLTWSATINIYFTSSAGLTVLNTIAAGNVTLADAQFAYVDLSETTGTALTVTAASFPAGGAASTMMAFNRIILAHRNTASDNLCPVYLHPQYNDPDKLVKSSNLSDVANAATAFANIKQSATTSATGVVELATVEEAVAGTSTTLTPTCYGVGAAVAVVAREPDQGVNMTAAASGSNGIAVADDDDIDYGTGNFFGVIPVLLADYTPATEVVLEQKTDGTNGREFTLQTNGKLRVTINTTDYDSTVATGCTDNTKHVFGYSVTRETAAAAGSIIFVVDGVQLGDAVAITAGAPTTINNAVSQYVLGTSATRTAGIINGYISGNRALTAAEHLALYRNGISEADKWGSQTEEVTGDDSDFDTVGNWTGTGATLTGGYDSGDAGHATCLRIESNDGGTDRAELAVSNFTASGITANKKYQITFDYKWITKPTTSLVSLGAGTCTNTMSASAGSWATFSDAVTTVDAVTPLRIYSSLIGTANDELLIDNLTLRRVGATLALEPGGIQPNPGQWLDSSTNRLHAMQPATGSSLTRYKKDFEYRWTNTWTASSAAQYVGGLNQAVLSADHFITDIITQATVTTDVENLTLGDGSDADRFVTAFAPSATRTKQTVAAQNDGTNLKLVYTPAAEATMTVETIIRGFIWEP